MFDAKTSFQTSINVALVLNEVGMCGVMGSEGGGQEGGRVPTVQRETGRPPPPKVVELY